MIRKIIDHSLVKNTFRIFTSNVLVQVVSFIFLPVFSRIYTPEDYGIWGVFVFMSSFIAVFAGLRFELAVMIPESNRLAFLLYRMTHSMIFIICGCALLLLIGFYSTMISVFQLPDIFFLWLLVPIHSWLTAMNNLITQWYSRLSDFKTLSRIRLVQSFLNIAVSFILGYFFNMHYLGLIFGLIVSILISDIYLSAKMNLPLFSCRFYHRRFYKRLIARFSNFLFYSTPLSIINYFSSNILVSVIQVNYGSTIMGYYSNANRLVQSPLGTVSSAVSMVFYPHFSKSVNKRRDVILVFSGVLLVFSIMLLPFVFYGKEILGCYLGKTWLDSAIFIRLLFVYFVFSTAVGCISPIFSYLQKENLVLIWQIIYLACALLVFKLNKGNLHDGVYYYSLLGGFAYFLLFCLGIFLLRKED